MSKLKSDVFAKIGLSVESKMADIDSQVDAYTLASYKRSEENPNNLSKWFPQLVDAKFMMDSVLKLPNTVFFTLPLDLYKVLRSDNISPETLVPVTEYINSQLEGTGLSNKEVFLKNGVFSDKFYFKNCHCQDISTIGLSFANIFYNSTLVGAGSSAEVVVREYIQPDSHTKTIYEGMPLRTEFRVFYDFDTSKVLGVANYWHPDVMVKGLTGADKEVYLSCKDGLVSDFSAYKDDVVSAVSDFCHHVDLKGQWSVDIMKNGDDYWLIDMALMNQSALVNEMIPTTEDV